nr:hypothetical protein CFP56_44400 [Quercus suber]
MLFKTTSVSRERLGSRNIDVIIQDRRLRRTESSVLTESQSTAISGRRASYVAECEGIARLSNCSPDFSDGLTSAMSHRPEENRR